MSLQDAVELAMSYDHPCGECARWRARAEVLAEALQTVLRLSDGIDISTALWTREFLLSLCAAALARLPAQALEERRALVLCEAALREIEAGAPAIPRAKEVLDRLDAARRDAEEPMDVHGELSIFFDTSGAPRFSNPHRSRSFAVDDVGRALLALEARVEFLRRWLDAVRRCACGHAPEEHPGNGRCEGEVWFDGRLIDCTCVAYEEDIEEGGRPHVRPR